jgi:hypothetical protein
LSVKVPCLRDAVRQGILIAQRSSDSVGAFLLRCAKCDMFFVRLKGNNFFLLRFLDCGGRSHYLDCQNVKIKVNKMELLKDCIGVTCL